MAFSIPSRVARIRYPCEVRQGRETRAGQCISALENIVRSERAEEAADHLVCDSSSAATEFRPAQCLAAVESRVISLWQ
jgi:hypothetical protein